MGQETQNPRAVQSHGFPFGLLARAPRVNRVSSLVNCNVPLVINHSKQYWAKHDFGREKGAGL
jgi:hypothetical protein